MARISCSGHLTNHERCVYVRYHTGPIDELVTSVNQRWWAGLGEGGRDPWREGERGRGEPVSEVSVNSVEGPDKINSRLGCEILHKATVCTS